MSFSNFDFKTAPLGWGKTQHLLSVMNDIAILLPVFLIVFTWRGFIQAAMARLMGDRTAKDSGFLTLNPIAHIDVFGLLIIMAVFFFLGGLFHDVLPRSALFILLIILGVRWTHPVPIEDSQFTSYRLGGIVTALSGPIANIILAFMATGVLRLVLWDALSLNVIMIFVDILKVLIDISLFFALLDLVPLPPFDGGRLLRYALPDSKQYIVEWLEDYSLYILFFLFFMPGISDVFLGTLSMVALTIKKLMFAIFF